MRNLTHNCPACGGDGKATCTNPDHGFIHAISFHDIGRISYPVCGHNNDHKVRKWNIVLGKYEYNKCECCQGIGRVTEQECVSIMDEYEIDEFIELFANQSGVTILLPAK